MAVLSINGTSLPNPSSYTVMLSDLDSGNTSRNAKGTLIRDRIRAGVYKIDVGWDCITRVQLELIVKAVSPSEFMVKFFDPTHTTYQTVKMYAGDRTSGLARKMKENRLNETYWNLSFSLIQY